MLRIKIVHEYAPGYGWGYECASPWMHGGLEDLPHYRFEDSRCDAESAMLFFLEDDAEQRGEPAPRREDIRFEHVVLAGTPA